MREKKTYKRCALLIPYQRQCLDCTKKNCAIRTKIDWNEEHGYADFNDDNRDRITESIVLGN